MRHTYMRGVGCWVWEDSEPRCLIIGQAFFVSVAPIQTHPSFNQTQSHSSKHRYLGGGPTAEVGHGATLAAEVAPSGTRLAPPVSATSAFFEGSALGSGGSGGAADTATLAVPGAVVTSYE